jgi:transposase
MVLSMQQRMQIVFLVDNMNYTLSEVARATDLPLSTVSTFLTTYRRTGQVRPAFRAGSGRPRILSLHSHRMLNRASTANPKASASRLATSIGGECLQASTRTIQRALNRIGRHAFRPITGPNLSRHHRAVRVQWARAHLGWSGADWAQVIFSDETYVDLTDSRSHFVRRGFERISAGHVTARRAYVRRVLFWGCISSQGTGPLVPSEGTIDAIRYQHILQGHLRPIATTWYRRRAWWFQQDNAPAHRAASTLQWLADKHIRVMEWPPYSPDINPIENMWAILKQEIHRESVFDKDDLVQRAQAIWNSPSFQIHSRRLIDSMHQRCFDCVRLGGGVIGY